MIFGRVTNNTEQQQKTQHDQINDNKVDGYQTIAGA